MFAGKVIHGDGIGKKLGFPTANLEIKISELDLKSGVYSAQSFLLEDKYSAALIISERTGKVEVHLLDYVGEDFYGEKLKVEIGELVSLEKEFESFEELKEKIKQDINLVKNSFKILNSFNPMFINHYL